MEERFLALRGDRLYVVFMAVEPDQLRELPPPTPAPAELCERATTLVRSHPECFWFRHPEARIRHLEEVRLVVEHLREYGDRRTWRDAQELHRCLSPLYKKTS
jgi:hypothetical protein